MGRYYGSGPIDGSTGDGFVKTRGHYVDEGYIDYLTGDAHGYIPLYVVPEFSTGVINMPKQFPAIDESVLITNNQPDGGTTNFNGDNVEVSAGYHAIEFLLWGQDDTPAEGKIPGQRSYRDYLTTTEATAPNGTRRAKYLQVVTQLLVDDLKSLVEAWAPDADNYRKTFLADGTTAIAFMFVGIGTLAKDELAGERMGVPLALHAQEQEHSCFSDNTHRAILCLDLHGHYTNVYYGKYIRTGWRNRAISGMGLSDYVKAISAADDARIERAACSLPLKQAYRTSKRINLFDWLIGNPVTHPEIK